jgi:hypothetical protein
MGKSTRTARIASITNRCQGGGSKKAGSVSSVGVPSALNLTHIQAREQGKPGYFPISFANQIGGVGRVQSMTRTPADGVNRKMVMSKANECKKSVPLNYRSVLSWKN